MIVPGHWLDLAVGLAPRRLRCIGVAGDDHKTKSLESVRNDRSLRRPDNVVFLGKDQDDNTNAEHAEAHEVGSPEALVHLHKRGSEKRQATDVDASVEHHVDSLEGDRWVDDDSFASLCDGSQSHLLAGVLIGNEGSDVRFDATSSETDDNDGGNVATEGSTVFNGDRKRSSPEDHKLQ